MRPRKRLGSSLGGQCLPGSHYIETGRVVESLACTQGVSPPQAVCVWGAGQEGRIPSVDKDMKPALQGDVEEAWVKKGRGRGRGWAPSLQASAFPAAHAPSTRGSWSSWLAQRVCVFPTSGTLKWQEVPWGMGTGCQAYRGDVEAGRGKKWSDRAGGWSPPLEFSAFLAAPGQVHGCHGVPVLHPACVSLPQGTHHSSR